MGRVAERVAEHVAECLPAWGGSTGHMLIRNLPCLLLQALSGNYSANYQKAILSPAQFSSELLASWTCVRGTVTRNVRPLVKCSLFGSNCLSRDEYCDSTTLNCGEDLHCSKYRPLGPNRYCIPYGVEDPWWLPVSDGSHPDFR